MTAFGFGALTFAFINNSPRLQPEIIFIDWSGQPQHADFRNAMVEGMLRAAGRTPRVLLRGIADEVSGFSFYLEKISNKR